MCISFHTNPPYTCHKKYNIQYLSPIALHTLDSIVTPKSVKFQNF